MKGTTSVGDVSEPVRKELFDPEQAVAEARREFGEHGDVSPSIERSSTFTVMEPGAMPEIFSGKRGPDRGGCYLYSRHFNPTVDVLDRSLAAMEGTEFAVSTASGMAAIVCTLLQLCRQGDHLVASHMVYGGTHALLQELLPQMGVTTTFVPPHDTDAFARAIQPNTKVLYAETLGNPTLAVPDIPALGRLARERNITLVMDNTFAPMIVSPARLGSQSRAVPVLQPKPGLSDDALQFVACRVRPSQRAMARGSARP